MSVTIYGIHPVLEALKKRPRAFHRIVLAKQHKPGAVKEIIKLAEQSRIKILYDSAKNIHSMCHTDQHQGVCAQAEPVPLLDLQALVGRFLHKGEKVFFLVLDSIQDPHNFGSLIRSALCSGVQGIIFPKDRSAGLTASVVKSSAGAIEHIPLCRVVNIASTLESLKCEGIWIVGTAPHGRETIYEFDFDLDMALVVGGEDKGIRPLVKKKCDFCLSIPMQAGFDSLNASVAGAVVLFEVMRQRQVLKSNEQ